MSANPTPAADLCLEGRMDIVAAESLLADLHKLGPARDSLTIDASEVTLIDTPVIQILLAAARDQDDRDGHFTLLAPSPAVIDAMTLLGLEKRLTEWSGSNE